MVYSDTREIVSFIKNIRRKQMYKKIGMTDAEIEALRNNLVEG